MSAKQNDTTKRSTSTDRKGALCEGSSERGGKSPGSGTKRKATSPGRHRQALPDRSFATANSGVAN